MRTRIPAPRFVVVLLAAMIAWILTGVERINAQATDTNLVGTVTDQTGAAVPNATVEITNTATNVKTTTMTNMEGLYRFNNLPAGTYDLRVTRMGFSAATLRNVILNLNQTATQNVTLQVGDVATTIEVTETPALIDTTTAQVQSTFQTREAIDTPASSLPMGVLNLSLLSAGVANPGGIGLGDGPSVGGQRPRNNSFNVEGVDNNRRDVTGHNVNVPNEAVAEFSMLQNQFSAEFGNATGGQFNTVIKSGGNQIHGSLFEYFQNRNLNAMDNLNVIGGLTYQPRYDQNTFGGSIGGPIIKNKLFYYGLYQYNPTGQAPGSSQGAIYAPTAAGYATLASIPGVSQTNLNVLKQYLPAAATASSSTPVCPGLAGTDCKSTTAGAFNIPIGVVPVVAPSYLNITTYLASIDYNASERDQLRGRFINEIHTGLDPSTLPELPAFFQNRDTTSKLLSFSEFHNFSPSLLNEFRFGYQRYNDNIPAGNFSFPGLDVFPNISINNDLNVQLGPYMDAPQSTVLNTIELLDNVSLTKGKHTWKFGWDGRKYNTSTLFIQRQRGDYEYNTLSQYILDYNPDFIAERNLGAAVYNGNSINNSLFFNDSYRMRQNLTVNVGLRWDYQGIPYTDGQQALNAISSVPGLIEFRKPSPQLTAFAPRFGIAYSPGSSGKTSIRAGFGIFYDKIFENLSTNSRAPQISNTVDSPLGGNTPGYLANGGIKPTASGGPACTDAASCRSITSSYIYDQQLPYAISYNLGVQHVFANDYTLEVRYLGTKGVHLFTQSRINAMAPVNSSRYLPTYLSNPGAAVLSALPLSLGALSAIDPILPVWAQAGFDNSFITAFPNRGNSRYNGLAVDLKRRFARNLLFDLAYTWSHNIDDSTADLFSTLLSPRRPQDFQNMTAEKSDSFLDRRHRFTFNWVYDAPWFKSSNNKFARYALGGYIFSGTYTYESPQFATVQSGVDSNMNFDSAPDRAIINPNGQPNVGSDVTGVGPNGAPVSKSTTCTVGGLPYTGSNCIVAYVAKNPNAQYIVAGKGALATGGRQTMALRPINNWDIQVKKAFIFTERTRFELAAQAFNLFNHPQYVSGYINIVQFHNSNTTRINLIPSNAVFGQPDQVYSSNPRIMQLTARIQF
jgi:hypothetical protein